MAKMIVTNETYTLKLTYFWLIPVKGLISSDAVYLAADFSSMQHFLFPYVSFEIINTSSPIKKLPCQYLAKIWSDVVWLLWNIGFVVQEQFRSPFPLHGVEGGGVNSQSKTFMVYS